jgi:NAD(P)-dependent dehydrogenase (short-subunit alcohol dehydrogenase family)
MNSRSVEKPVAVVIGAGSGMGAASALRLYENGYRLKLADVSEARLEELAQGLDAEHHETDVTSDAAVSDLAAQCRSGVDALVVSAGLSMSMAPFERIMDVNLGGSTRVLNRFEPIMKRGGAVVCFASIAGHLMGSVDPKIEALLLDSGAPELGKRIFEALPPAMRLPGMAYGLSKLGILKLVQRTAVQFGKRGVRVCSVSPGLIDTPMGNLERKSSPDAEAAVNLAPVPRLGTAEEVANVVSFLCSPAASYVTGCDLLVDGGWVGAIHSASGDSPFAHALAAGRNKE